MTELIREYWDWFLFDTLLWTGVLIGVALLLRRPVAKHLGAGAAYALWFLPLARLVFPPVTLPAWMKPSFLESAPVATTEAALSPVAESGFSYAEFVAPVAPATMESPIDFVVPLVVLWAIGAAVFMGRRFWLYGQLRKELLEDAKPVGEVGKIRLVETTAISGPMAFGVIDKVVALPDGFMASRERQVRDLAIAHELAHHRGHDILVNVLIQPLFAVHWFNPLGWMGWTAMRRDQEAACDARVVASRTRDERAAYAAIIADFARRPQIAPRPALAAPMACPVLGDKSIIHRLRSLPMTDTSRRRRLAARGAVAAAVLALPMTASVCYGVATPALAAEHPKMADAVHPVGDPVAPTKARRAQLASFDDEAFNEVMQKTVERKMRRAEREMERAKRQMRRAELQMQRDEAKMKEKSRMVWKGSDWDAMSAEERKALKKEMRELREQFAEGGEFQQEMAEVRRELEEDRVEMQREMREAMAEARASAAEAHAAAKSHATSMRVFCGKGDTRQEFTTNDGKTTVICDKKLHVSAVAGLRQARAEIASDPSMPKEIKVEILRSMDAEIARHRR